MKTINGIRILTTKEAQLQAIEIAEESPHLTNQLMKEIADAPFEAKLFRLNLSEIVDQAIRLNVSKSTFNSWIDEWWKLAHVHSEDIDKYLES